MKHAKCYVKGFPRPQFVRKGYDLLNGEWEFAFDEENVGEREAWYLLPSLPLRINVPYAYQSKRSGIGTDRFCENVWYRRTFSVRKKEGERVLLHFDGCDYRAKVWFNGAYLGDHEGGYSRFTFDVTDKIGRENVLVVKCEDGKDVCQPRGKQRWLDRSVSCFYTETTGIWKSVWLEYVGERYLEKVDQEILFETDSVKFVFHVNRPKPGLKFRVEAEFEGEKLTFAEQDASDGYGEVTLRLVNKNRILPVKYWSPATPHLFDLRYVLTDGDAVVDEVGSYAALVRYDAVGGSVRLNYSPSFYLKMALDQGYFPEGGLTGDEEELERDVRLMKEMGFNGVRKHEKIEDERFCYFCDVYGLVLWCEMPSFYSFTQKSVERFTRQWLEILGQYRNFPCIMAYVPFNESWGIMHVSENRREQQFTQSVYYLTKTLCPDRFVISNDGWDHTKSDLLTLHNYVGSGEGILDAYGDLEAYVKGEHVKDRHTRSAYAKGFFYAGQPVLITECVGVTFASDVSAGGWGYGKAADGEREFLAKLQSILGGIRSLRECGGYCITQLCDVMQEKNGLLTEERVPKAPLEKIRAVIEN
ncbi:MAG: glycoside hydrolase family 2 protein [Candidatus Gallimonas sp.]